MRIGITLVILTASGNIPVTKECFISLQRGFIITGWAILSSLTGILEGPEDL